MSNPIIIESNEKKVEIISDDRVAVMGSIEAEIAVEDENEKTVVLGTPPAGPTVVVDRRSYTYIGDANYVHTQAVASDTWIIEHPLNKNCSVTVVDTSGNECEGHVKQESASRIVISFSAPFSGKAYLN